jgi:protein tyrosine phosphatase (PTP) superfamily phosphohydrolase (DUF442 family)
MTFSNSLLRFSLALALFFAPLSALAIDTVSFDLDETLISSGNMTDGDLKKAKELGFKILKTKSGDYEYIVRPGAAEVLAHAKELGFRVVVITCNFDDYARDIISSSDLHSYVDAIYSADDLRNDYNTDYETYPYHRNRVYKPARSTIKKLERGTERLTLGVFEGVVKRSFLYIVGNHNIRPYYPSANFSKYPPIYGSRFHVDDTERHVDQPMDFVGVHVSEFDGTKQIRYSAEGKPSWTYDVMEKLEYLKKYGWVDLYRREYHSDPVISEVKMVN